MSSLFSIELIKNVNETVNAILTANRVRCMYSVQLSTYVLNTHAQAHAYVKYVSMFESLR